MPETVAADQLSSMLSLPEGSGDASLIDRIVREGARKMLVAALQGGVDAYVEQFAGERDEQGHRLVLRNWSAQPRTIVAHRPHPLSRSPDKPQNSQRQVKHA